ncbi:hypothetical protein GTQ40_14415 [Flavobacteriaceae bacterium R38]|nr:hypothetical protein [Flavobacteriaceae bacterium R38]
MESELNIISLLEEAEKLKLYQNLINQLNKDFNYANVQLDLVPEITPIALKKELEATVYWLIQEKFTDYLNLLYIIDVPEKEVKKLKGDDIATLSGQICFLILKREWQKVWYRNQYQ